MADPVAPPSGSTMKWTRVVLAVSLTLNLLVVGLVLGARLGDDHGRDRDGRRSTALADVGFGPFTAAMTDHDRRALGEALVERGGSLRENRKLIREQFRHLLDVVSAEPFDPAAVRAAMANQQATLAARQEIGFELFLDRLTAMSPAERKAFAQRLEQVLQAPRRDKRPKRD